jgi:hypothetical protein
MFVRDASWVVIMWAGAGPLIGSPALSSSDTDGRLRSREPDRGGEKRGNVRTLMGNTIVGPILLFLTNLLLADEHPTDMTTVVICAILGVVGRALVPILHLLGMAL